ncbi:bacterioferritin-associated ferredoxin [Bradyrhizobium sp. i1.3.1]
MDQTALQVARAVEAGATTMKGIVDATGLSRLKVERALSTLEKQKLLVRDGQGFRATGLPKTAPLTRQCGSCNACCDILEVAAVDKPVNQLCRHWQTGTGCTIYDRRPQMCRSFVCAWLQGHLDDAWFPATSGIIVHFSQDAVNVTVDDHCPDRWREEPYFSKLVEWSLNGIRRIGNRGYATLVVSGENLVPAARTHHRSRADAVRNGVPAAHHRHLPVLARDIARASAAAARAHRRDRAYPAGIRLLCDPRERGRRSAGALSARTFTAIESRLNSAVGNTA